MLIVSNRVKQFICIYLHFQSKPLINLYIFATLHSLVNDTKFDLQLSCSLARAIQFKHRIHSRDVTLVM